MGCLTPASRLAFAPACLRCFAAFGRHGAATSIWGENAEMVKYGVLLSAECDSVSVRGLGILVSAEAVQDERHPMDCAVGALCADFRLYLQ